MKSRTRKSLFAWLAIPCALAGLASLVAAHTYPTGTCSPQASCEPDNNDHTYCHVNTTGEWETALINHRTYANTIGATEYRLRKVSSCTSLTDVHTVVSSLSGGRAGVYFCENFKPAGSGFECEQAEVHIDLHFASSNYSSQSDRLKFNEFVWCHEFGHSLGLEEGTTSSFNCMRTGASATTVLESRYRTYSSHNIDHIENDLDNVL